MARFRPGLDARTGRFGIGMLVAAATLASCTVLPIEEAQRIRERDGGVLEVAPYVDRAWQRAQSEFTERSVSLEELYNTPVDALGQAKGSRAGEGSPWTFLVTGEGVVRAREVDSPRGQLRVDTAQGPVILQIGPVVSGTALRDALPFITFDDVADQTTFAEVGLQLTDRALAPLAPTIAALRPGDRIAFAGAASRADAGSALVVTPTQITPAPATRAAQ